MTLGTFSAMLIRDLVSGKSHPWKELFAPNRKSIAGMWEYLVENRVSPLILSKTGRAPGSRRRTSVVGRGKLLASRGKKRAVYLDEHGKRTMLSAVCPHMGCVVAWNSAERTRDCPCHGSRFTATGEVISGPAESNLECV